jgi:hypothetical protein
VQLRDVAGDACRVVTQRRQVAVAQVEEMAVEVCMAETDRGSLEKVCPGFERDRVRLLPEAVVEWRVRLLIEGDASRRGRSRPGIAPARPRESGRPPGCRSPAARDPSGGCRGDRGPCSSAARRRPARRRHPRA